MTLHFISNHDEETKYDSKVVKIGGNENVIVTVIGESLSPVYCKFIVKL